MARNMTDREDWRRVISFEQFKKLVNSPGWAHQQKVEIVDRFPMIGWGATINYFEDVYVEDWAYDVEVYYVEHWAYDENDPGSFSKKPQGWIVDGVKIVHENGDEVTSSDLAAVLPAEFTTIDYSKLNI